MPLLQTIIAFIRRRILCLLLLIPYFWLWVWSYDFLNYVTEDPQRSCGLANGAVFSLLVTVSGLYLIIGITLLLLSKDQKRKDFMLLVAMVLVPIIKGLIDLFT